MKTWMNLVREARVQVGQQTGQQSEHGVDEAANSLSMTLTKTGGGRLMDIRLRTHRVDGATVVEVGGDVELHSANQLREELSRAGAGEHPCVVVDLSRVSFIDSTGLGVLVGAFKRVREYGSLSVVCPQRSVRRVFEITGLLQVFPFHQNLAEAVKACAVFAATRDSAASVSSTRLFAKDDENLSAPEGQMAKEAQ